MLPFYDSVWLHVRNLKRWIVTFLNEWRKILQVKEEIYFILQRTLLFKQGFSSIFKIIQYTSYLKQTQVEYWFKQFVVPTACLWQRDAFQYCIIYLAIKTAHKRRYSGLNERKKLLLSSFTQLFGRKTPSLWSQNLNLPNVFKISAQRKLTVFFMKIICIQAFLRKSSMPSKDLHECCFATEWAPLKGSLARKWGFNTEVFKHLKLQETKRSQWVINMDTLAELCFIEIKT